MRTLGLLLVAAFLSVGCLNGGNGEIPDVDEGAPVTIVDAPWWNVGERWTVTFEQAGKAARTTTLVNFANNTFNDPEHFWLGVKNRDEAMQHVFFENNPFLGRIHWLILAPHEKGMHSAMYSWPMEDGSRWDTGRLFGLTDVKVEATRNADGVFDIAGKNQIGGELDYSYDPSLRWFGHLDVKQDGQQVLRATVTDHVLDGAKGTFYFLRGRDYIDSAGSKEGMEQSFQVKDEGATSVAFLVNVQAGAGSRIEFISPDGQVFHSENLLTGGTSNKIFEVTKAPPPGAWKLRYFGNVEGDVKVRGIIEYKATL